MQRLTDRLPDGTAYVVSETGNEGVGHFTTQRRLPEVIARLAAYEDTGLTPEQIEQMKARLPLKNWAKETPDKISIFGVTVSRLIELAQAEKSHQKQKRSDAEWTD